MCTKDISSWPCAPLSGLLIAITPINLRNGGGGEEDECFVVLVLILLKP